MRCERIYGKYRSNTKVSKTLKKKKYNWTYNLDYLSVMLQAELGKEAAAEESLYVVGPLLLNIFLCWIRNETMKLLDGSNDN